MIEANVGKVSTKDWRELTAEPLSIFFNVFYSKIKLYYVKPQCFVFKGKDNPTEFAKSKSLENIIKATR